MEKNATELFQMFRTDDKPYLDKHDIKCIQIYLMGIKPKISFLNKLWRAFKDKSNMGFDINDLSKMLSYIKEDSLADDNLNLKIKSEYKMCDYFELFDVGEKGHITQEEIYDLFQDAKSLKSFDMDYNLEYKQIANIYNTLDLDQNGLLTSGDLNECLQITSSKGQSK